LNHLAHFLLCPPDDALRAGTLIADYARGTDLSAFHPQVERGIRLHRRVDALVDRSPQVMALKPLVDADLRRYAGILLDVFFDYALIRHWSSVAALPRAAFSAEVYASLERQEPGMPLQVSTASARMRAHDALASCASIAGCAHTLGRIAQRLKRPVELAAGIDTLVKHEAQIVAGFLGLLPALQAGAQDYLSGSSRRRRPFDESVST